MTLLAVDPGTIESAWLLFDGKRVLDHGIDLNSTVLFKFSEKHIAGLPVWFEQVASYGMPVGAEVFETVFWTGRFYETAVQAGSLPDRVTRLKIKLHLCGSARAKDSHVWQAILDRFSGKAVAIGTKKLPGPLYGVHSHSRAALALAIYAHDTFSPR